MTINQIQNLLLSDYDIVIEELPSAIRFLETYLKKKVEYSWNSINKANSSYDVFIDGCSNYLGIHPYLIDKNLIMNLEVTGIGAGDEFLTIFAKYESL